MDDLEFQAGDPVCRHTGPEFRHPHHLNLHGNLERSIASLVDCSTCISSDATESDLPGLGRSLGRVYIRLGLALEHFLNRTADRLGFGPHAIERWLNTRFDGQRSRVGWLRNDGDGDANLIKSFTNKMGKTQSTAHSTDTSIRSGILRSKATSKLSVNADEKNINKKLKKLVSYTHSEVASTQTKALQVLNDLLKSRPEVQIALRRQQAHVSLSSLIVQLERRARHREEVDSLLHISRTALISVEESELNTAGRKFITLQERYSDYVRSNKPMQIDREILSLLSKITMYLSDSQLAFLATRYLSFCDFQQLQLGAVHRPNKTVFLSSPHLRTAAESTRLATGQALRQLLMSRSGVANVELDVLDCVLREMFWWLLLQDTHADDVRLNSCMVELAVVQELLGIVALPVPILPIAVWNLLISDPTSPLHLLSRKRNLNRSKSSSNFLPALHPVSVCEIDQRYFDSIGMIIKRANTALGTHGASFDDIFVQWTIEPGYFPMHHSSDDQHRHKPNLVLTFSISVSTASALSAPTFSLTARICTAGASRSSIKTIAEIRRTTTLHELSDLVDYHSEPCRKIREGGMRSMTHYWLWCREPGLRPQPIVGK